MSKLQHQMNMGVVESEVHFTCGCPLHNDLRQAMNTKYIYPKNAIMADKFEMIKSTNCRFLSTFICHAWYIGLGLLRICITGDV